jgi:hypothetical protein
MLNKSQNTSIQSFSNRLYQVEARILGLEKKVESEHSEDDKEK